MIYTGELILQDLLVWGSFWVTIRTTFTYAQEKHFKRLVKDIDTENN